MAKWTLKESTDIAKQLESFPLPLVVLQLLVNRGIDTTEKIKSFLTPDYGKDSHDPFLFVQMLKVVQRVKSAKEAGEKVVIFGDYDADGITASAILKQTLDEIGIDCFVYIPDKKTEGYGLNMLAIDIFLEKKVKLVITVDCGITGAAEVARAKELGIDVIITDHHHVPQALPEALAIINPHQYNCGYPFAELAGVGVAFKVSQALYEKLLPTKMEQTKWMLDLAAIGTIADCVPLVGENRLLVKYGLLVLAKTRRVGLRELFSVGRMIIDENNVPDVRKVSFHIAPRINAAGRINHANLAYDLIMESDSVRGRDFALELEASNTKRQKITQEIVDEVKALAKSDFADKKFIFAVSDHYSIGVVGLVAGKIAQQFNKPVAIFQQEGETCKGSFRSIPQINIIETIEKCKDLVLKFGGHSQAAGVSVATDKMAIFCETMGKLIEEQLLENDCEPEVMIDAKILPAEIDFDIIDSIEKLKPFGVGNPQPIFMMEKLAVQEIKSVGSTGKHLKMSLLPQDGTPKIFETIAFDGAIKLSGLKVGDMIDIAFTLERDEWNGNNRIQLVVEDAKKVV